MEIGEQISRIREITGRLLQDSPEYFIVDVRIGASGMVRIFIDGDQGVGIDQLTRLNKALCKAIPGSGIFPQDNFSLEVSSPGLEEPLRLLRQYQRNVGRQVEVMMTDGPPREGLLKAADDSGITLEMTGPKGSKQAVQLAFKEIKHTKVIVVF